MKQNKSVKVRLSGELLDKIVEKAKSSNNSVSKEIRLAIKSHVEK